MIHLKSNSHGYIRDSTKYTMTFTPVEPMDLDELSDTFGTDLLKSITHVPSIITQHLKYFSEESHTF